MSKTKAIVAPAPTTTTVDNDLLANLTTLRTDLENWRESVNKAEVTYQKHWDFFQHLKNQLPEKEKKWEEAIAKLPENMRDLLIPQTRQPKTTTTTTGAGTGKEETIARIRKVLADGPMTEVDLRAKYGAGKKLRVKGYIASGLLVEKDGKIGLA